MHCVLRSIRLINEQFATKCDAQKGMTAKTDKARRYCRAGFAAAKTLPEVATLPCLGFLRACPSSERPVPLESAFAPPSVVSLIVRDSLLAFSSQDETRTFTTWPFLTMVLGSETNASCRTAYNGKMSVYSDSGRNCNSEHDLH